MKYVVVLYDGMADYGVPALDGKTPMMCAKKPLFDSLSQMVGVNFIIPENSQFGTVIGAALHAFK